MAMEPEEADAAERDGWAQICHGQDGSRMRYAVRDEYPPAVAWFAARKNGDKPALDRRDLVPEPPAPALNRQMETESRPGTYKTKATAKKRGRKPKFSGG